MPGPTASRSAPFHQRESPRRSPASPADTRPSARATSRSRTSFVESVNARSRTRCRSSPPCLPTTNARSSTLTGAIPENSHSGIWASESAQARWSRSPSSTLPRLRLRSSRHSYSSRTASMPRPIAWPTRPCCSRPRVWSRPSSSTSQMTRTRSSVSSAHDSSIPSYSSTSTPAANSRCISSDGTRRPTGREPPRRLGS